MRRLDKLAYIAKAQAPEEMWDLLAEWEPNCKWLNLHPLCAKEGLKTVGLRAS